MRISTPKCLLPIGSTLMLLALANCKPRLIDSSTLASEESDFLRCKQNVKGYALIVTGYAMSDVGHEFSLHTAMLSKGMAARGYCVVTLFSEQVHALSDPRDGKVSQPKPEDARQFGVPEEDIPDWVEEGNRRVESMYYRGDVEYFRKNGLLTEDRKATKENIDRFFKSVLTAKVGPNSKRIFMSIGAHGHPKYTDQALKKTMDGVSVYDPNLMNSMNTPQVSSDFCRGATHECTINSCKGLQELYDTNDLQRHFYNASTAGFQTWLTMRSCHSGGLRQALAKVPNHCFAASTVGLSPSHGCGEVDSADNQDYTSTSDAIVQILSQPAMAEMENDPYFKSKKCFAKYLKHAKSPGFQSDHKNLFDIFWAARKYDRTWDHATISSLDDFAYFQGNEYSVNLRFYLPLDLPRLENDLKNLPSRSDHTNLRSRLLEAARAYQPLAIKVTEARRRLDKFYESKNYNSPEVLNLQKEADIYSKNAEVASKEFLKRERMYIDAVRLGISLTNNDTCRAEI